VVVNDDFVVMHYVSQGALELQKEQVMYAACQVPLQSEFIAEKFSYT